eukprot:CAMPEP_0172707724 /NCGR_PEP_ID=MMETSP1074-20121228/50134_1 /TAXON_ID=2916 /ORGANISM="Ceratium fusus, Strain PA161109" /LENGTH=591 /DNA_ID=CAMNT_0013530567 /DNA_START=89 /DNA_END=1864 /DNA_ORIENTATION=-
MNRFFVLACMGKFAYASWKSIAGYQPGSKVTDHNAIDLDQKAIEIALSQATINYQDVYKIYSEGGNSKAYAKFTVNALAVDLKKKSKVVGSKSGIQGSLKADFKKDATEIEVLYPVSESQELYVDCKVGALSPVPAGKVAAAYEPYQYKNKCFQNEVLQVTTNGSIVSLNATAEPTNKAGRTLRGFSTKAGDLMFNKGDKGCKGASNRVGDGCPYLDFTMYKNYYGIMDYADNLVSAAINAKKTGFTTADANMDFGDANVIGKAVLRKEVIKKGTAYMNAYMYAIREFEDAIDDCKAGCANGIVSTGTGCNKFSTDAVHAWDEGVAFYTGSLEGPKEGGDKKGVLSYRLAEKRCANFKTCGKQGNSLTGTSYVNTKLFNKIAIGQSKLLMGQCDVVRPVLREMVALMSIPLIQGTLRYAYKIDRMAGGDKEKGEGAIFAAAIVPRVHHCNAADGNMIMKHMKIGALSTSFSSVKSAFEKNYQCMNITCAEVGGLWNKAENKYYADAGPCSAGGTSAATGGTTIEEKEKLPGWAIGVIVAVSVVVALCGAVLCFVIFKEMKSGEATFGKLREGRDAQVNQNQPKPQGVGNTA